MGFGHPVNFIPRQDKGSADSGNEIGRPVGNIIDHVTLSESVSLVNDNFQTETISKLKTARWVAQLVEYEFCYSCDHHIGQIQ